MTQHDRPTSAITDKAPSPGQADELLREHRGAAHDAGEADARRADNPSRVHWLFAPSRYERFDLLGLGVTKRPGKGSADES